MFLICVICILLGWQKTQYNAFQCKTWVWGNQTGNASSWHEDFTSVRKQKVCLHVHLAVVFCWGFERSILGFTVFFGIHLLSRGLWSREVSELKLIKHLKKDRNTLPNAETRCFVSIISHSHLFHITSVMKTFPCYTDLAGQLSACGPCLFLQPPAAGLRLEQSSVSLDLPVAPRHGYKDLAK